MKGKKLRRVVIGCEDLRKLPLNNFLNAAQIKLWSEIFFSGGLIENLYAKQKDMAGFHLIYKNQRLR